MNRITVLRDRRSLFLIAIIVSIFSSTETIAQTRDTVYYKAKWEKTERENKHFYRVIHHESQKKSIRVQDYYPS